MSWWSYLPVVVHVWLGGDSTKPIIKRICRTKVSHLNSGTNPPPVWSKKTLYSPSELCHQAHQLATRTRSPGRTCICPARSADTRTAHRLGLPALQNKMNPPTEVEGPYRLYILYLYLYRYLSISIYLSIYYLSRYLYIGSFF